MIANDSQPQQLSQVVKNEANRLIKTSQQLAATRTNAKPNPEGVDVSKAIDWQAKKGALRAKINEQRKEDSSGLNKNFTLVKVICDIEEEIKKREKLLHQLKVDLKCEKIAGEKVKSFVEALKEFKGTQTASPAPPKINITTLRARVDQTLDQIRHNMPIVLGTVFENSKSVGDLLSALSTARRKDQHIYLEWSGDISFADRRLLVTSGVLVVNPSNDNEVGLANLQDNKID